MTVNEIMQKNFGDFQTPVEFATKICKLLKDKFDMNPDIIIEPTCGEGNFIKATLSVFNSIKTVYGVEIQEDYFNSAKTQFENNTKVNIIRDNIFVHVFNRDELKDGQILIIGNPPWVTNSDLGALNLDNLPEKRNFKGVKGMDAITGKGNFDIAEYIMLKLINEFSESNGYIAMLCKNIVVRNILLNIKNYNFSIGHMKMYNFNAKDIFGASCDASLFVAKLGVNKEYICEVYNIDNPDKILNTFGWVGDRFVSDVTLYKEYMLVDSINKSDNFEWRQGIKHDCSKVMEFDMVGNSTITNGLNQNLEVGTDIEEDFLYGLLKSSDLKSFEVKNVKKQVLVTQRKIKEDTSNIKMIAPRTWEYLLSHGNLLDSRKSSIYNNSPRFSIFGIGDYSFAKYKVAISGMYKKAQFSLIHPVNNKPVMLDDTCYFLSFDDYVDALITCALLNSIPVQKFLNSVAFIDNKRPYTKDILMRIDIIRVAENLSIDEVNKVLKSNNVNTTKLTQERYSEYISKFKNNTC